MRSDLPAGTVTFLFTDVEGSTRLLHELGAERYAEALAEHRRAIREACASQGGVEVDTQGDAFFFAFPTAPGALAAASALTEALASGPIQVRAGLHTGTPLLTDEGYVGGDVHRAARIAASGHGGQVLVSASTASLLDLELRDLGEHRFKDLAAPERVYQLGEREFPRLKTLYQTNLPIPATPFLGRERELEEVVELLLHDGMRLLTLTGPGGTGKTRLAVQAAAEAADAFPEGVVWVPLAPIRDPALVLSEIATALELTEEAGTALATTVVVHLAGKRLLLLLDNAEHLLPSLAGDLTQLLSAEGAVLLVTSRERLQLHGEQLYPVPPLAPEDGVSLFLSRARALEPTFSGNGEVSELCARLENLPLALELAAARTTLFTPQQLIERIGQRLDLLKGGRDADPRQQTLRATIEWSYDLLDPAEQVLFRSLSVFDGGCTYEAAEEICGADPDVLQSLLDKSLLRRRAADTAPRYWMLETIREFAAERLDAAGEAESLRRRHGEFYAELVVAAERELTGPDQERWWPLLADEMENIRVALAWACGGADPGLALRLTGAMWRYWWQRCYYEEGTRWYEAALAIENEQPEPLRARAVYGAANMALGRGDLSTATRLLLESQAVFERHGETRYRMWVLTDLGIASLLAGDHDMSRRYMEAGLAIALEQGWTRDAAIYYGNLGAIADEEGDLDLAAELFEGTLAPLREAQDRQMEANMTANLASVELRRGRLSYASELLSRSLTLGTIDDTLDVTDALITAAAILSETGDARTAAVLVAHTSATVEQTKLKLDVNTARLHTETTDQAREALGPDAFDDAWAAGCALTSEGAVALALEALADE